ncbi:PAS domain-containing sensor histidine kinase [Oceanispirochaeta sp.]|uniref:PAS domain-containing hybrid sensor histidine kinase/response regulator n=1 Tax=Oceanispirochaeta sp. TaxID=2035350 RepID=UPI002615F57E|nr:PAS domain-containing sensor histidine kinase [Oceanispirochaeta sp.]MDA3957770.1 PAS domain S-box protein [Oceanispirochaeta sp.]
MAKEKSDTNSLVYAEGIINTVREPLIVLDQDLRVISANCSFFNVFKVTPEETMGQLIYDLGNNQWDIPQLRELLETILPEKTTFDDYKVEHYFNTLGRRIMLLNARQIKRKEGEEKIILLAFEDITDRELAQLALEDSEERFRRLFETAKDGLLLIDKKNGHIVNANPAVCKLLGYTHKELIGMPLQGFNFSVTIDVIDMILEKLVTHGLITYDDISVKNKMGSRITIDLQIIDRSRFLQCNFRDITERKVAEKEKDILTEQLNQAQRMETVGILAGGIAHDFNNILSIIFGNAELALNDISPDNPVKQNFEEVLAASIRAKDLVSQILTFSRKDKTNLIPIHPQPLINETLKLLRSTTPATISIIQDISKDCGKVMTDITQFHQVIMNLFGNAVQAMDEKGEVIVSLKEVYLDSNDFTHFSKMSPLSMKTPGAFAKFSVVDSGTGIDQKIVEQIFEPFFTTKKVGEGTGMGLSVVQGIIQSQEGFITVESEEGKGSTFSVFLPITQKEETLKVKESNILLTGTERILLVDDEELLLQIMVRILEGLGYNVMSESSSNKALETFKANPTHFDLLMTDQSMPDMSGAELVAEILKVRPNMPIIICSGYSTKVSEKNYKDTGVSMYLSKPYSRKELSESIRTVLDGNV